jgi:hypothetical protein
MRSMARFFDFFLLLVCVCSIFPLCTLGGYSVEPGNNLRDEYRASQGAAEARRKQEEQA